MGRGDLVASGSFFGPLIRFWRWISMHRCLLICLNGGRLCQNKDKVQMQMDRWSVDYLD